MGAHLEARMAQVCLFCAEETARRARALAPVDSGELREGIGAHRGEGTGAAAVSAAPHGAMVEFGTSKIAPRPHMLPAAEGMRRAYFEAARAAAREVVK